MKSQHSSLWSTPRAHDHRPYSVALAALTLLLLLRSHAAPAQVTGTSTLPLDQMLRSADSSAVEEAGKLGSAALPVIRHYVRSEDYRIRQLTMRCTGRIGVDQGSDILAAGLLDENINVQNAAANELAKKSYPGAATAILKQLSGDADELVKEKLALAAGYLPGSRTIKVLRPIAKRHGILAGNARMAMARLHDVDAQQALIAELNGTSARVRYDALEKLIYVNDRAYAPHARRLLDDKTEAVRVGMTEAPRYRRVCDEAVDALVSLLQLTTGFHVSSDKIYSDAEIVTLKASLK